MCMLRCLRTVLRFVVVAIQRSKGRLDDARGYYARHNIDLCRFRKEIFIPGSENAYHGRFVLRTTADEVPEIRVEVGFVVYTTSAPLALERSIMAQGKSCLEYDL